MDFLFSGKTPDKESLKFIAESVKDTYYKYSTLKKVEYFFGKLPPEMNEELAENFSNQAREWWNYNVTLLPVYRYGDVKEEWSLTTVCKRRYTGLILVATCKLTNGKLVKLAIGARIFT